MDLNELSLETLQFPSHHSLEHFFHDGSVFYGKMKMILNLNRAAKNES